MTNADELSCQPCAEQGDDLFFEEEVDMKKAMFQEPIVGEEQIVLNEYGPGALEAKPLASPNPMTPAELARHNPAHLPYHPACPICRATRCPNTQHRAAHEDQRLIPRLVADYCFVRSTCDSVL